MKLREKLVVILAVFIISFTMCNGDVYAESINAAVLSGADLIVEKETAKISLQSGKNIALLNGKNVKLEPGCRMIGTQLFTPVKFIVTTLGGKYEYNSKTKYITVLKDDIKIIMMVGSKNATINGKKTTMLAALVSTKFGITGPVKFIAEALGARYEWKALNKTAVITAYSKTIVFPDKAIEAIIRKEIKKPTGDISIKDIDKIQILSSSNTPIKDLSGLQYLPNLKYLFLDDSNISDISPLSKMKDLQYLSLSGNEIKDLSPLSDLKNLKSLVLTDNFISDISPLKNLPESTKLSLWHEDSMQKINTISDKAREIVDKVIKPAMTDLDKELSLYDYLVTHCRYDKENYDTKTIPQKSHDAYGVLTEGVGVCDGYAETMQILLSMVGIESRVVIGETIGPNGEGHAWNIVKIDGQYYQFDITFDDPVNKDNQNILRHSYFNLSDKQMSIDHKWNRSDYPQCNIDSMSFYTELTENKQKILFGEYVYNIIDDYLYKIESDGSYKKICEDRVSDINLSGDWIYYLNKDDDSKVYRIKTDGTEKTKIIDYKSQLLSLADQFLYCIYDYKVHRTDLSGANGILLSSEDAASYFKLSGDWLYYKAFTWASGARMYKAKTDGSARMLIGNDKPVGFKLNDGQTSVQFYCNKAESFDGDWVYFINEDDGNKLYKIMLDGSGRAKLSDDKLDIFYTELFNGWIYYQSGSEGNKYCRVRLDGSERQLLE